VSSDPPFQQLDTRHLEMDALPVALSELNGNTFQSIGGRTANLLGECETHQAKSEVWGTQLA